MHADLRCCRLMTKSILSQLSIIMTSSFNIVSPPRIRGGIRQVSGGTTAGPRRIRGGIRVSRGGIESGQVRGSAGGLEKLSAGVSGLVKKRLECTVAPSFLIGSSSFLQVIEDMHESLDELEFRQICNRVTALD